MKKNKLIACMLSILLLISVSGTVQAAESVSQPSEKFIQFCEDYFLSPMEYKVVDKEDNDISQKFYDDNIKAYKRSKIDSIWKYTKLKVSMFKKSIVDETQAQSKEFLPLGSLITKTISDWFYVFETSGSWTPDFELQYYISGRYVYSYNTGEILEYTGPTVWIEYCDLNGVWSYAMTNVSTRGTIASNKYSIVFSASFKLQSSCSIPIGDIGIPGFGETFGPYSGSLVGYPE